MTLWLTSVAAVTVIVSVMQENSSEEKLQEFGCEPVAEAFRKSTGSLLVRWTKKPYSAAVAKDYGACTAVLLKAVTTHYKNWSIRNHVFQSLCRMASHSAGEVQSSNTRLRSLSNSAFCRELQNGT